MIYYCTTFNARLYNFSGKDMIASFKNTNSDGKLLVFYEDKQEELSLPFCLFGDLVSYGNITNDELYWEWIRRFSWAIPPEYGGKKTDWFSEDQKRSDYNRQAARWFWKVVALKRAKELIKDDDILIFVDCDSTFQCKIAEKQIQTIIGSNHWCFHQGRGRRQAMKGIESGIMLFSGPGFKVIDGVYNKYMDGGWLSPLRWDDGYIFSIWEQQYHNKSDIKMFDLVFKTNNTECIPMGPFKNLICHHKGIHQRSGMVDNIGAAKK